MQEVGLPIAVLATGLAALCWQLKQSSCSKQKPQAKFTQVLADNSDAPFLHLGVNLAVAHPGFHPLHTQIHALDQRIPESLSRHMDMPAPIQRKACKWVASPRDLQGMLADLTGADMLAVDVEHHHMHSYLGFVCLLQLSAGGIDYVVDALALHDHLHCLGSLLADPRTLKVVHGGDNDILWLQRDFHLYMVNVFDTEKACQVLGRHQRGLGKLLEVYCNVATDKSFQKSDWRIRPLPKAQLEYAQRDAHYLLYIAHKLYQELQAADAAKPDSKGQSKVMQAWQRCQKVSLNLYSKHTSQAAAHTAAATILRKRGISPQALTQLSLQYPGQSAQHIAADGVHALCRWRDQVAREEDEGLHAILPEAVLLALATECPSTASLVIECAQRAMHNEQPAGTQQNGEAYLQKRALPYLREQADHAAVCCCQHQPRTGCADSYPGQSVSDSSTVADDLLFMQVAKLLVDSATGVSSASTTDAVTGPAQAPQNRNQARQLMTPEERQAALKERLVKKFSAKSAVYENCKMLSQDGHLLCFCDLRKLTWYENRGLAERISDDPPTIKLRFMHKTGDQDRGVDGYYLHSKENKCVACGEEGHYLRYRVVPACYRRNFPVQWKSHRSHDIVLLCVDCHHVAHRAAERVKRELSKEYSVPLTPPKVKPEGQTPGAQVHPDNIRRAAIALRQNAHSLPEKRRQELQQLVRGYVNQDQKGARVDGEGWLSQAEMESALLAGLAPRQRRRILRQLAAQQAAQPGTSRASAEEDGAADQNGQAAEDSSDDAVAKISEADKQSWRTVRQSNSVSSGASDTTPAGVDSSVHVDGARHTRQQSAANIDDPVLYKGSAISKQGSASDVLDMADADPGAYDAPAGADVYGDEQHASETEQDQASALPQSPAKAPCSRHAGPHLAPDQDARRQQEDAVLGGGQAPTGAAMDSNGHLWHGKKVVEAAMAAGGIDALLLLIQRFRQSFTEALQPQFLPASWHVSHK